MPPEIEQRRPWTVDEDCACDVCGEVPLTGPVVSAPIFDDDPNDPSTPPDIRICEKCLDDARLTLEAHREALAHDERESEIEP